MAAIDYAHVIAEFAADPLRTSLELPHMTTGQRKSTKKLLEQYPELQCQSYGFGAERQLHLFKEGARAMQPEDASISIEGSVVPDASNTAKRQALDFSAEHKGLEVRNTFIHFGDTFVDERAVQSMPHGMFKQCLLTEAKVVAGGDTPTTTGCDTPSTTSESDVDHMCGHTDEFSFGTAVVVEGLVKAPAFNGRSAIIQGWDHVTGRYDILLASDAGRQHAKVKKENLRIE